MKGIRFLKSPRIRRTIPLSGIHLNNLKTNLKTFLKLSFRTVSELVSLPQGSHMTNAFLLSYVRDQFGFIPRDITEDMKRAARLAYKTSQNEEPSH